MPPTMPRFPRLIGHVMRPGMGVLMLSVGLLLIAGGFFAWSGSSASNIQSGPSDIGPAGTSSDFKAQSISVSYRDTATPTSNPITEAGVGEDFRVRVDFTLHNNGPDPAQGVVRVQLLGPPEGCEFLQPASGVLEFPTGIDLEPSVTTVMAFAELKVRCTTPGDTTWSALVTVSPQSGVDEVDSNNAQSGSSMDPITITGGTVEDTPTPTASPTPGASGSGNGGGGCNGGPPPVCPTLTPTPTPTFLTPPPSFPFQDPWFSVRADNPSGLDPADILRVGSIAIITCDQLGLDCDGVDGQGPPIQDDLDALTLVNEKEGDQIVFFSTDSQSRGIEGSGTHSQSNEALQCHEEGNEYAEFPIGVGGDNRIFFPATALGLAVTTCPDNPNDDDDMDALSWGASSPDEAIILFSLAPGSPTLTTFAATPADIFSKTIGGQLTLYRTGASLGLQAGDDIDGICLFKNNGKDVFLLTLSRGSPTLANIGATPDDLLFAGGPDFPPNIFKHGSQYGLLSTDNIDAVKCQEPKPPGLPQGDIDCDGDIDIFDLFRLLFFLAGLPVADIADCPDPGDGPADALVGDLNCDGVVDDADLIPLLLRIGDARIFQPAGCPPIGVGV